MHLFIGSIGACMLGARRAAPRKMVPVKDTQFFLRTLAKDIRKVVPIAGAAAFTPHPPRPQRSLASFLSFILMNGVRRSFSRLLFAFSPLARHFVLLHSNDAFLRRRNLAHSRSLCINYRFQNQTKRRMIDKPLWLLRRNWCFGKARNYLTRLRWPLRSSCPHISFEIPNSAEYRSYLPFYGAFIEPFYLFLWFVRFQWFSMHCEACKYREHIH